MYQGVQDVDELSDTGSFVKSFQTGHSGSLGVAVDSSGNVYVNARTVFKFEALTGDQLAELASNEGTGLAIAPSTNDLLVDKGIHVEKYGPFGEPYTEPVEELGAAHLAGGSGLAVGATGTVYIADSSKDDVDVFAPGVGEAPGVESESVPAPQTIEATLDAQINPDGQETEYAFEYARSEAALGTAGATVIHGGSRISPLGVGGQAVSVETGPVLAQATTYYYRAIAENKRSKEEGKPTVGKIEHFTTLGVPIVTTGEAQGITHSSATFSGTVNPAGLETTYYFAYIDQAAYEQALAGDAEEKADPYTAGEQTATFKLTEPGGTPAKGYEPLAVGPIPASTMLPGATYHYALIAKNEVGVTIGSDKTLTTLPATPPAVSTGGVSGVSQNSATLSGTVSTNSLQTNYGFEIATQPGEYGAATGLGSIGGASTETVSVTLGELQPGTIYYYRVTATNADGTSYGEPETFTTPGFPTLLTPQVSPPQIAVPATAFPTDVTESATPGTKTKTKTKPKTRAQKLNAALKQCHKQSKKDRAKCEKQAHAKYGTAKKKRK